MKTEQAETWDTSSHIRKRGSGPWDNSIDFRARYECILCLALEQGQARAIPHQQCSGLLPLLFSSFGSSTSLLCRWFHNWLLVVGQLPACQPGYFSWDHTVLQPQEAEVSPLAAVAPSGCAAEAWPSDHRGGWVLSGAGRDPAMPIRNIFLDRSRHLCVAQLDTNFYR